MEASEDQTRRLAPDAATPARPRPFPRRGHRGGHRPPAPSEPPENMSVATSRRLVDQSIITKTKCVMERKRAVWICDGSQTFNLHVDIQRVNREAIPCLLSKDYVLFTKLSILSANDSLK